jgi:GrpB-like predicted nucleotidyltransferase (UPF0157 family)
LACPAAGRSTAVEGLAAKPVVDIDVSVDDPDDEGIYVPALDRAGSACGSDSAGIGCCARQHLICMCTSASSAGSGRETASSVPCWLRTDAPDRARYAEAKRQLARRDWPDMNACADAKGLRAIAVGD